MTKTWMPDILAWNIRLGKTTTPQSEEGRRRGEGRRMGTRGRGGGEEEGRRKGGEAKTRGCYFAKSSIRGSAV